MNFMSALDIKIHRKAFSQESSALEVFQGLSLSIPMTGMNVILGNSGVGKSTLLRMIVGLDRDFEGSVGASNGKTPRFGMIFQGSRLLPWMSVRQNVQFAAQHHGPDSDAEVSKLLALVGFESSADVLPRALSGGMAQRVALARALVGAPELLLLDEPFSSLDNAARISLQDKLVEIVSRTGTSCLLVTHDLEEATYLADRVFVLKPSRPNAVIVRDISLHRPRNRQSLEFLSERMRLAELLAD